MGFDITRATPGEILAEARRREDRRKAGLPLEEAEVGVVVRPKPLPVVDLLAPMKIVLPWSVLVSDNEKYGLLKTKTGGRITLKPLYRLAKRRGAEIARDMWGDAPPFTGPVVFRGVLIEPNRRERRDIVNYGKLVQDVLKGVAYVDDSQIDVADWIRGAPDIDAPRLEITITPIGGRNGPD